MRAVKDRGEDIKRLSRKLVSLCSEYLAIKDSPEEQVRAAEIKRDILRLYSEISTSSPR